MQEQFHLHTLSDRLLSVLLSHVLDSTSKKVVSLVLSWRFYSYKIKFLSLQFFN